MENNRYNNARDYYKNKYGERVLKICIDGGFTCPNRDGTKGFGGCIFCGERGSGEKLCPSGIKNQINNYLNSYKVDRANKFIVYFQNFSGTYEKPEILREIYKSALIDERIVGINIGTRPDCINDDIVNILKEINTITDVTIELGLQTANEEIGEIINRQYTNYDFTNAVSLLNNAGIEVIAHIMIGLPNENMNDIISTVDFLNTHKLLGLKIHSTFVIEGTTLGEMYKNHLYDPIAQDDYIKKLAYVVNNINKNFILFRIVADAPRNLFLAPEWNLHKKITINKINQYFEKHDIYQGKNTKTRF
jgi:radical SAM protein (TIGR01212 family)